MWLPSRSLVPVDNFLPPRLCTHRTSLSLSLCWWVSITVLTVRILEDFSSSFHLWKKRKSFLHGFIFFSIDIFLIRAIKKLSPRRDKNNFKMFFYPYIRNNFLYSVDPIHFQLVFKYRATGFKFIECANHGNRHTGIPYFYFLDVICSTILNCSPLPFCYSSLP